MSSSRSSWNHSLVTVHAVSVPSLFEFLFVPVSNEPEQTDNSNFESQTQRRENIPQTVTTSSLFPIFDLI